MPRRKNSTPIQKHLLDNSKINEDGCRIWLRTRHPQGYGNVGFKGKQVLAHRLAYEFFVGPIPDGLHVLHKCDMPSCILPAHLFVGSHLDNMRDKIAKSRNNNAKGSQNGQSKLTESIAALIRQRYESGGVTKSELAKAYGVSAALIGMLIARKIWKHI